MRVVVASLLVCLCSSAPARAQVAPTGDDDAGPQIPKPVFTAPVLLKKVTAVYPKEAFDAGLAGTVILEIDLDDKGKVLGAVVKTPAGHGFDEAAVEAVKQFEFKPALADKTPIPSKVTYAYKFVIKTVPAPSPSPSAEQPVRLKGGLHLRGTRAPLPAGKVIALAKTAPAGGGEPPRFESTTDDDGQFAIKMPPGDYHIVVNAPKAVRFETDEHIGDREALTVNYYLQPSSYGRYETTVRADLNREEIARQTLTTEELVKMPGAMGDALRAIENLPGVARAPFNSGLIIVRGGKPTDSRAFLAGSEVPQLYHFGGFRSFVPTELIQKIDYFPGNFGARYGRAIAGAIDVELREGKRDRLHGSLETNAFDTGAVVEGPIGKGSFVLAARRSYVDLFMSAVLPLVIKPGALQFTTAPIYYDYQAMLDYPLLGGKFRALFFGSDDTIKLAFGAPQDADPQLTRFATHIFTHRLQLRWTRSFGQVSVYVQNSTGYGGTGGEVGRSLKFDVGAWSSDSRLEARWAYSKHLRILIGTDFSGSSVHLSAQIPPPPREGQSPSPLSATKPEKVDEYINIFNIGAYLEGVWKPTTKLTVTPGVRFDFYSALRKVSWNPRLTAKLQLTQLTWLKAGVGLYSQDPQPTDFDPAFGNPNLRPESALHTQFGVEQAILPGLMAEATFFYKHLYDLVSATNEFFLDTAGRLYPERVANQGMGRVVGGEFLLRQSLSKHFFGLASYTIMRSERKDCAACDWRLFDFDQTHIFILALHAYLPKGFEAGVRFRFISGYPYTPPAGGYYDADADVYSPARGVTNSARFQPFNSLDIRLDKTFLFDRWLLKVYLDVTNVYSNRNQEQLQPSYDFTRGQPITGLPIIPSFGVRGEF